jgi:hypothetical protein
MRRGLSIVVEEVAFNAAFLGGISIFLPPGTMAVLPPLPARERGPVIRYTAWSMSRHAPPSEEGA